MEENKQNVSKENEMIDAYIRRQAILKEKFPKILEAPKSIQDEYFALSTLIDSLEASGILGPTMTSDGCKIDMHVAEKYEKALAKYTQLNIENGQYITQEEAAAFEFPEIDFEGLKAQAEVMEARQDYRELYGKILELQQQPLPRETKARLNKLNDEMARIAMEKDLQERRDRPAIPATVNESKFASIYEKAKGIIPKVFGKIKEIFKGKTRENKENDNSDLDEHE